MLSIRISLCFVVFLALFTLVTSSLFAQSGGNSTSVTGTVLDPSGAVVPDVTVEILNLVSQFQRSTTTDDKGNFSIPNVPFNQVRNPSSRSGPNTFGNRWSCDRSGTNSGVCCCQT